jgi:hypothetical protein
MWHLRRVHMESVGHPDARFDPLTVNLTDTAGEPTSSVLWLENMGGKTSWLSLVFSTLRPSLSEFLGKPDKQLGDYILASDTAHVILEFAQVAGVRTLTGSGTRLLLGQVLQWRQHRQEKTRESAQLNRQLWGVVVPPSGGTVTFEAVVDLIHTDDAQRRPLADFTGQLADLMHGDVFRPDSNQTRWAEWLRHHGLDPDVFADQLKMSADEGSISERFHFQTGDQLVQWAMPYIIRPEVPEGIAAVVDQVKDTLVQRPSLLAQQLFCSTVESRLAYAATQQHQLDEQRAEATTVWDSSLGIADQFRAALAAAEHSVGHHRTEAARFEQVAKDAQSLRNQRQQQWRQAQLVAAQLHHQETSLAHVGAAEDLKDSQQRVDGWELTSTLRRLGEVESRLGQVDALLADVDDQAAPLREAVSLAESRLAAKLSCLRKAEQASLDQADEQLTHARADDQQAERAFKEAQAAHSGATSDAATAEAKLSQLDSEMAQAVEDGLLALGQPVDDAVASIRAEIGRLQAEVERLALVAKIAEAEALAARGGVEKARGRERIARAAFEKAEARSLAVASAAESLLDIPAVATAFDTAHPDLWHDGPAAADRLAQEADVAATERVAIELRSATDRRAVDWLDRTGLLPPTTDVELVLATLAKAGIRSSFSGWEVLRTQLPADRHADAISQHPEVVNGVVLTDPGELDAAVEATSDLSLTAPTALTIAAVLLGRAADEPIIVLPGPEALHDESAALEEGDRRQAQLDAADVDRDGARARETAARNARAALAAFLEANPAEAVASWRAETSRRLAELAAAERHLEDALGTLQGADSNERLAGEAVRPARDAHAEAQRSERAVQRLAANQARRPHEQRGLVDAQTRRGDAEWLMQAAASGRTEAAEQMDAARDIKTDVSIRISQIETAFTRNRLTVVDGPAPEEPVDTLERALDLARDSLLAAAPPDQLVKEQAGLQQDRSQLSAELRRRDDAVTQLARTFLASPEGATSDARDSATSESKRRLAAAQRREALAADTLEKAEADLHEKEAIPQSRRTPLEDDPTTADDARVLAERLAAEAAIALAERDTAAESQRHHGLSADEAEATAKAFGRECSDLTEMLRRHATLMRRPAEILDERREAAAWSGTAAQAEKERRERQTLLDEAAEYMRIASDERNHALDDVRHLANEHRDLLAAELPTLLPRLTEGHPDQRGAYAEDLSMQLRAYAMTIENQLADLDRHRRIVIDHLTGKVKETVKLLERMQRRTRLPSGLDEWSDRPFLHLTHPKLPETTDELTGRVATVVDRICAEPSKTPTSGMELLYAAVSAAVGGPFHASILKPHKRLTDERVDISEMASFSGGQKVTAALVMFAALTRMRTEAHSSGQQTNAALPLLLDNPIGKANQATLMEVQQRVADAFGLQLIYTTGLHDVGALASFRNIIRLDGRENPRSGRVHVVVDNESSDLVYLYSIRMVQHDSTVG